MLTDYGEFRLRKSQSRIPKNHVIIKIEPFRKFRAIPPLYLMREGFILLTRGYGFMGWVYHPPFDTLKISISTCDVKLKLYRYED